MLIEYVLVYVEINYHSGQYLANDLLEFLNNNIHIKYYRTQSYENFSNISGIFNEMQDIIINHI